MNVKHRGVMTWRRGGFVFGLMFFVWTLEWIVFCQAFTNTFFLCPLCIAGVWIKMSKRKNEENICEMSDGTIWENNGGTGKVYKRMIESREIFGFQRVFSGGTGYTWGFGEWLRVGDIRHIWVEINTRMWRLFIYIEGVNSMEIFWARKFILFSLVQSLACVFLEDGATLYLLLFDWSYFWMDGQTVYVHHPFFNSVFCSTLYHWSDKYCLHLKGFGENLRADGIRCIRVKQKLRLRRNQIEVEGAFSVLGTCVRKLLYDLLEGVHQETGNWVSFLICFGSLEIISCVFLGANMASCF